ncbi:unnamed protein product [Orchesella dallaii]|uniref:C2H2-type domain-containing protein n=1 Tax=Orchesella dallaii TaxID=48710 RepID=A0ABP1RHK5_9HEXA
MTTTTPNQVTVCFLCLKELVAHHEEILPTSTCRRNPLYLQFISFVRNYLEIAVDTTLYGGSSDGDNHENDEAVAAEAFCDLCSETVSNICDLYKKFCAVELRLSSKLEELGILIKKTKSKVKVLAGEDENILQNSTRLNSLAEQLNLNTETVFDLRNSILLKCFQKSITEDVEHLLNHEAQEIDGTDTEIKEEVESLPDQDDDYEEESEQFEGIEKNDSSESESDNHCDSEGSSIDPHQETDSDEDEGMQKTKLEGHMKTRNKPINAIEEAQDTNTSHNDHSEEETTSGSGSEDNESSLEMETEDQENNVAVPLPPRPRRIRRSYPPKIKGIRRRHIPRSHIAMKNLLACEANGCRAFFKDVEKLNSHLKTHSSKIYTCSDCKRGFMHPEMLKLHKLLHTKKVRGRYPCSSPSCSKKFQRAMDFQSHYNVKHGWGLGCFKCPKCELNLASEPALIAHLNKHDEATDPSLPITEALHCIAAPPCSACGLQFLRRQNLDAHRKMVHNLGVECPDCDKIFGSREAMRRHMSQQHKPDANQYICPVCGKSIRTKDYLREHIVVFHPDTLNREGLHQCSHCLMRFHRKYLLDDHLTRCLRNPNPLKPPKRRRGIQQHLKARQSKADKSFSCEICGILINKKTLLHQHMKTHKNSKSKSKDNQEVANQTQKEPFVCDICGEQFLFRNTLTRHLTRRHGIGSVAERKFLCQICGNGFTSNGNLLKHGVVHRDEKKFACHLCPYKSKVNASLKTHLVKVHGKVKGQEFALDDGAPTRRKLNCRYPSCKQSFFEESELKLHVEQEHQAPNDESGAPTFMCNLCGRIFLNQQRLTRHNEVHSQEKRYKCPICQKGLSQPNSVKEHMSTIHGVGREDEYFTCTQPNCNTRVRSLSYLYRHLRTVHGVYTGKPRKKPRIQEGEGDSVKAS